MTNLPKISFGIIVLNNEPFTRYLLRQLYPFAHQIIVVEGATSFASHACTEDGHSRDGTVDVLRAFQKDEDPDGKLLVVTAEDEGHPDGFWPGEKDEMSRAYAKRAAGDWLWQVDGDEFYRNEDMERICRLLEDDAELMALSFPAITFWGSPQYWIDGPYTRGTMAGGQWHRLFRWKPGYVYATHRLPTVVDENDRNLREVKWLNRYDTDKLGITMFHYSFLFPHQVSQKVQYYAKYKANERESDAARAQRSWSELTDPFHVHNVTEYPSWLEKYSGAHPEQIEIMWDDIQSGRLKIETRDMVDVKKLMHDPGFRLVRAILRRWPSQKVMGMRGGWTIHRIFVWIANLFEQHWVKGTSQKSAK